MPPQEIRRSVFRKRRAGQFFPDADRGRHTRGEYGFASAQIAGQDHEISGAEFGPESAPSRQCVGGRAARLRSQTELRSRAALAGAAYS